MNQIFFKVKFEDKLQIDYVRFKEINEVIAKIRFEGYGKILAPMVDYHNSKEYFVNELGNEMYISLQILNDDDDGNKLRNQISSEIKNLGYKYSHEISLPSFIEIFYNTFLLENPIKFENEFKTKIKECGGFIKELNNFNENYNSSVLFGLECQMQDFEEKLNEILKFLIQNVGDDYFVEYY